MKKIYMMLIILMATSTTLIPHNHHTFNKKCNQYFYSKLGVTMTVGPLIGALIGIANRNAESIDANLTEKIILWCVFGILNGMTTKTASILLDSLDIPHSERGLGATSWIASWIAYWVTSHKIKKIQIPHLSQNRIHTPFNKLFNN